MAIATSLTLAVHRFEDRQYLERVKLGIDTQAWGTVLALGASIIGPMILPSFISCETFAFVVAALLSTIAAITLGQANQDSAAPGRVLNVTAMALGSLALFVPTLLLRTMPDQHIQMALIATLLVGGLFWFASECAKMRLLEECAHMVAGREIIQGARQLRWGVCGVILVVSLALLPAALGNNAYSHHINARFFQTISVSILIVTLLGTLLYGRMSLALTQQVAFALSVRKTLRMPERADLPDEPDWHIDPA